jgi:hypothetical protein
MSIIDGKQHEWQWESTSACLQLILSVRLSHWPNALPDNLTPATFPSTHLLVPGKLDLLGLHGLLGSTVTISDRSPLAPQRPKDTIDGESSLMVRSELK